MEQRIQIHEQVYLGLGVTLCGGLMLRAEMVAVPLAVGLLTACYAWLLFRSSCGSRWRLLAAYLATWALYSGSTVLVEWMHVPLRHETLLAGDAALFRKSPAIALQTHMTSWVNELLALGYMSYHVYLHWVLIEALCLRDDRLRAGLSVRLFTAFGVGFAGYILFPAAPPATAFPELFAQPISGGFLVHANEAVNAALASRYDAFPSLHVLITATLLAWDWRTHRWRFWLMLVPSTLMLAATLGLRLHYAVDLIASTILFIILTLLHARFEPKPR